VLKKLTATGIMAAAATGVMLLGGQANADRIATGRTAVSDVYPVDSCYYNYNTPVYYRPAWCANYPSVTIYPPTTTYAPPAAYYPGYYGWNRWHRYPWHFHH
jgi:hypothetical protein